MNQENSRFLSRIFPCLPKSRSHQLVYFCSISLFSYLGFLSRYYLQKLAPFSGFPSFVPIYAEIIGSFVLGIMLEHKGAMIPRPLSRLESLFIGVCTGFCGSLTTFSSWNSSAMLILVEFPGVQFPGFPSGNATRFFNYFTILFAGISMPFGALKVGRQLGTLFHQKAADKTNVSENESKSNFSYLDWIFLGGFLPVTILVLVLPNQLHRNDFLFYFLFAAVGANLRHQFSRLNKINPSFPWGTFLVNVSGCWFLSIVKILQDYYSDSLSTLQLDVLQALDVGFCGCLTTISTFVAEIEVLPTPSCQKYVFLSVFLSQLGLFLAYGIFTWR